VPVQPTDALTHILLTKDSNNKDNNNNSEKGVEKNKGREKKNRIEANKKLK